jgi:hypothetical protein
VGRAPLAAPTAAICLIAVDEVIHQFRNLVTVAEEGSFTHAMEREHV